MSEFIKKEKNGVVYYTSPQLAACRRISHAFFTRKGGLSKGPFESLNMRFNCDDARENVLRNHIIGGALVGAEPANIVCTNQKHTDRVRVIKGKYTEFDGQDEGVDALVSDVPGLCLTAYFADCQIVMLFDHKKNVAAIVHAGWRGVQNGIVVKTLDIMREEWGCDPADIFAAVGPSICRSCFETDEDVPRLMEEAYGVFAADYIYKEGEKWHVDLKNITYSSLVRYGVSVINIDMSGICTVCDHEKDLFWSQRRCGDIRGVQGAMIMIKNK
ncbi:MAG: laccase domain-containing protein [Clostridia bacterium]|nr:laccase domain-containing protein [Clostridia bacterium]